MSITIVLLSFDVESSDLCDNVGPCCFSCPQFDHCEQHFDESDEA